MESIIARALEYTLKYWLKSFSRDQFKLQGRTGQLSNLEINGDALHSSLGLPPALNVTTARVGKLEITLPSVSNVQVEPIVVQIDKLDLVLEENADSDNLKSPRSAQPPAASTKGSGYGYSDKIADGMTVQVGVVNLMLETRGGSRREGGATWSPPLASITIRNLILYTTNENWEVVNLKEARDFSNNTGYIYVFKKLEWQSLSIDLLPHPDMFTDALFNSSNGGNGRDDDGAKRMFFGGERFLEGISGEAKITVQRTEQNSPLGLEVQLHITEAVCPALSEPGLRALLRFMTGLYVCLNRGDVDPKAQQRSTEAAGCSLVSILVDHIFFCIKDAEFQLELLMQSLFFSRSSVSYGECAKNFSCIKVGGLFLRDTFSRPPCTLIQPSMTASTPESPPVPEFGQNFCPPIYPLENELLQSDAGVPLICLYSLQINPSPLPPKFASQSVITCQPLMITLKEEACMRISSFLSDGIVVSRGSVLPDSSIDSLQLILKEFDLSIPLDNAKFSNGTPKEDRLSHVSFSGARLHVEELLISQSPSLKCPLLNLEKDPACFALWEFQPMDASQRKWAVGASTLSLSLETSSGERKGEEKNTKGPAGLWKCVELKDARFEAAMVTADGSPLVEMPPPDGIVRIGVACGRYISNTSVEQLFFVLDLYSYFGLVGEKITKAGKGKKQVANSDLQGDKFKNLPSDTAVSLFMDGLELNFLNTSFGDTQGTPLVQFCGTDLFLKVSHRTLGGAIAVSTDLQWKSVSINCLEGEVETSTHSENGFSNLSMIPNGTSPFPKMRAVFWVDNNNKSTSPKRKPDNFLDVTVVHVLPHNVEQDLEYHSLNVSAKISGVRLGGGMSYAESLLHRFGILGPDGGPGEGLLKGVRDLSSGPLAKLFKSSPHVHSQKHEDNHGGQLELGIPDDLDVSIELRNWLFALEGTDELSYGLSPRVSDIIRREEKCWHTTFRTLHVSGKSSDKSNCANPSSTKQFPVDTFLVGVEGLQAIKPRHKSKMIQENTINAKIDTGAESMDGVDIEATVVNSPDLTDESAMWTVENIKFSVKQPIEAVATKEEIEHLVELCRGEADSLGRITAAILKLLKLDKSLGQATLDQLSSLGSGGVDRVLTPRKLSRQSSFGSINFTPSTPTSKLLREGTSGNLEETITLLESETSDIHTKCTSLVSKMSSSDDSRLVNESKELNQKLENMQMLLSRLRGMI
ncbi:UHRF1-binding protein 1-like protein [Carex littledalei]|uniref:UHRF1-binding protein 1-like protein n=1 Tax=Carex littledalei TaxID=544730 RepID=A0A833VJ59_9POAL|nr:UHRF1-binding protein 1-like protein [Carex littledalei]